MSMSKTVESLLQKKKDEMATRTSNPTPKKPSKPLAPEVDVGKFIKYADTTSYEDIVGEKHPDGIERLYPKPFTKWDHPDDIPKPNDKWVPDHDFLPALISAFAFRKNAMIIGKPGCGKTRKSRGE